MEVDEEEIEKYYNEMSVAYEDYELYYEKYGYYPVTIEYAPETYQDIVVVFDNPAEIAEMKNETLPINVVDFIATKYANAKVKLDTFTKAQTILASLKKEKEGKAILHGAMIMFLIANPNASEEELLTDMYNKLGGN